MISSNTQDLAFEKILFCSCFDLLCQGYKPTHETNKHMVNDVLSYMSVKFLLKTKMSIFSTSFPVGKESSTASFLAISVTNFEKAFPNSKFTR